MRAAGGDKDFSIGYIYNINQHGSDREGYDHDRITAFDPAAAVHPRRLYRAQDEGDGGRLRQDAQPLHPDHPALVRAAGKYKIIVNPIHRFMDLVWNSSS